jgi:hypothetical protein
MINFIKEILKKLSCMHKWQLYCKTIVKDDIGGQYYRHTFICKECGKFKRVKI